MLKQFKSNIALVYAVCIIFILSATAGVFYKTIPERYHFFSWYSGMLQKVERSNVFDYILTVLVLLVTGYFINKAFNKTSFYSKNTGFPIFVYILIASTISDFYFHSYFILDLLFSLVFLKIIDLDQNKTAIHVSFLSGILIGCSFLFSFWLLPVGTVVFYSLLTFRPFQYREWLVGLLGMVIPAIYLFSIQYLNSSSIVVNSNVTNPNIVQYYWYDFASFFLLLTVVLIALINLAKQFRFQSNIERRQVNILAFFTSITFILSVVIYWMYGIWYMLFTVPLTLLISLPILNMKKGKVLSLITATLLIINLLRIYVF
ncbi:MAG: DUF6427 family protein [Crocinitomicaceae bacterium]